MLVMSGGHAAPRRAARRVRSGGDPPHPSPTPPPDPRCLQGLRSMVLATRPMGCHPSWIRRATQCGAAPPRVTALPSPYLRPQDDSRKGKDLTRPVANLMA